MVRTKVGLQARSIGKSRGATQRLGAGVQSTAVFPDMI